MAQDAKGQETKVEIDVGGEKVGHQQQITFQCVCVCVRACVRAYVRVRACVRMCVKN